MNNSFLLKLLLSLTLLGINSVEAKEKDVLQIFVDPSWPPFSSCENGIPKGTLVDLVTKTLLHMPEFKTELVCAPWKRGLAQVESGEGFAIFGVYKNEKRPYIDRYSDPLYVDKQVLRCSPSVKAKNPKGFPKDFRGFSVATLTGYSFGEVLNEAKKTHGIHLVEVPDWNTLIRQVLNNRMDCFVHEISASKYELDRYFADFPNERQDVFVSDILNTENMMLGYSGRHPSVTTYREQFIKKYNEKLKLVKSAP